MNNLFPPELAEISAVLCVVYYPESQVMICYTDRPGATWSAAVHIVNQRMASQRQVAKRMHEH